MTKKSDDQLPSSSMPQKPPVLSRYGEVARKRIENLEKLNEVKRRREQKGSGLGSTESRPYQAGSYSEMFGEGVPPGVGRFAATTGLYWKLKEMLQEQINKGEPVKDWDRFAEQLHEAYRARL